MSKKINNSRTRKNKRFKRNTRICEKLFCVSND